MNRTPLIAGNWKMYTTVAEGTKLAREIADRVKPDSGIEVVLCPPFLSLGTLTDEVRHSPIQVFAQNMHYADEGAFTGEISPAMLKQVGVDGVILGHSERRQYFGETDESLKAKVPKALAEGLTPVLCVGESESERRDDQTETRLAHQVASALADVPVERLSDVVIAYEPIWAIGTGAVATSQQAQTAVAFIRDRIADIDRDAAEQVRILYGGSVKPGNAHELLALSDVDGALVGGASLKSADFIEIVDAASFVVSTT